jgi:hypothetical protein
MDTYLAIIDYTSVDQDGRYPIDRTVITTFESERDDALRRHHEVVSEQLRVYVLQTYVVRKL